jgi:hypothetical protein
MHCILSESNWFSELVVEAVHVFHEQWVVHYKVCEIEPSVKDKEVHTNTGHKSKECQIVVLIETDDRLLN